jgi:undecaprenyl-diphosphatase
VAVVVAAATAWAVRRGARLLAAVLVAVAGAAEGLNVLLKLLFHRPRPDLLWAAEVSASYSFPSGHSMVSAAAYAMTALVVGRLSPRLRAPAWAGSVLVILLIGCSRVYLGVHWPTDVAAGFTAGALLVVAAELAVGHLPLSAGRRASR